MMKLTPVDLIDSGENARWCSTSRMLPPASPISAAALARLPGASGMPTCERDQALGMDQAAQDHDREQAQVDVAAAQDQADPAPGEALALRS